MSKKSEPAIRTAAEISTLLGIETQARDTGEAEYQLLKAQDTSVARKGADALTRHRGLMSAAEIRRDVAKAKADELREQLAEAEKREAEQARRQRYDAHINGLAARRAQYQKNVTAAYEALFAALTAGKAEQDETDAINHDLPAGAAEIEHFEAPWRHSPAVADRYETVEVMRQKDMGADHVHRIGEMVPLEKVTEQKLIRGTPARMPRPLWETIALPRFDNDFVKIRVGDADMLGGLKVA